MIASSNVSDPWDVHIQDTPMTIEWYGYRDTLDSSQTRRCIEKAASEALQHLWMGHRATPIGALPYSYSDGRLNLWLRVEPGETLVWLSWLKVLFIFPQYLEANEWKGTQFLILWDEHGETKAVAFGHLLEE